MTAPIALFAYMLVPIYPPLIGAVFGALHDRVRNRPPTTTQSIRREFRVVHRAPQVASARTE